MPGRRHMPASGGSTSAPSISVKGTAGKRRDAQTISSYMGKQRQPSSKKTRWAGRINGGQLEHSQGQTAVHKQ